MNNADYKKFPEIWNSQDGFSMIELLIAVVIIVFGMLAFGSFSGSIIDKNENSQKKTIAVNLAQEKLENTKNEVLNSGTLTDGTTTENNLNERGVSGSGIYTRTTVISGGGSNSLATVTVTISWIENTQKSISLTTKILQS